MQGERSKARMKASGISKRFYRFGGGAATRLIPALVVVVVVPALRAALLAVALITPGRGLVRCGGFVIALVFVVPRPPAGGGCLVGDVCGVSFCFLAIPFSLSNPAVVAVRVLVAGLTGSFSWALPSVSLALPLSLAAAIVAAFLTSTLGFVFRVADVVAIFFVLAGFTFLGDVGVFLFFRGGSGSSSIEMPSSSSNVSSLSISLPFQTSSNGLAQSSSIKVASGARLSAGSSTAIESKGSSGFPEDIAGGSRGGDILSTVRTLLRGLGLTGE